MIIVALGACIHLPSLGWGFFGDDYNHQVILSGIFESQYLRPWSLYDFGRLPAPGEPGYEVGAFPWWTAADCKLRFFRPLTSLSLWLDHALYGNRAFGYHVFNLVLYGGFLAILYRLYVVLDLGRRASCFALAIFACSDNGVFPVGWVANRNTLLASFFTVSALLLMANSYKRRGGISILAPSILAVLAALSKESGLSAFLMIALYGAMASESGKRINRAVVTGCLAAFGYALFLLTAGYGVKCLFYGTPWSDPAGYLMRLATLVSVGGLSLVAPFPLDILNLHPEWMAAMCGVSAPVVILLVIVIGRSVRGAAMSVFWTGWIVMTLLPQAVATSSDRLLFLPMVGSSALIGAFLAKTLRKNWDPTGSRGVRVIAKLVAVLALPLSALSAVNQGLMVGEGASDLRRTQLAAEIPPPSAGRRDVILLQSPSELVPFSLLASWAVEKGDRELRVWPMQSGRRGLRWTRIDEKTFELESTGKPFLTGMFEKVFLTSRIPPPLGWSVETALFTVEITKRDDSGVWAFRVRCAKSLESPEITFLESQTGELRAISPPPVGGSIVLEEADNLNSFFP